MITSPPPRRYDYVRDADAIYVESFATIRAEADLSRLPADAHPRGRTDDPRLRRRRSAADIEIHPQLVSAARTALTAGAPIFTDAEMTASGITRRRLPAANEVRCLLHDPRVPELAQRWQTTRTAAAVSLWGSDLEGAVVAIGNAPTALFHLLELIAAGGPATGGDHRHPGRLRRLGGVQDRVGRQPVGHPVPGGARSPWRLGPVRGRDQRAGPAGGDLVTGSALRGRGRSRRPRSADRQGGPAHRVGGRGRLPLRPPRILDRPLDRGRPHPGGMPGRSCSRYPVTTGETDHPGGYSGVIADFYDASAERLAVHLDAGRAVVVLAEGDPLFYCSYGYLHDRLAGRYRCEVVPGVTSLSATSAAVSAALGRHEDVLTVLPGTLPVPELAARLAGTDAVMIMKLGRTFAGVVEALRAGGPAGPRRSTSNGPAPPQNGCCRWRRWTRAPSRTSR